MYLCIGTIIYKITAVTIYFNFFFPLEEYCTRYVPNTILYRTINKFTDFFFRNDDYFLL